MSGNPLFISILFSHISPPSTSRQHTQRALSGQKRCRTPLVSPWRKPIFLKQSPG